MRSLCLGRQSVPATYPFAIVGLFFSAPVFAHHAFSAEYDAREPVMVRGTVTKVEWSNPHAYVYLQVRDKEGNTAIWTFEMAGPLALAHDGWTRDSIRAGDQLTVFGYRSWSGLNIASARSVVLKTGQKLSAGSPYDGGPKEN
jgi:Family of unknown function (DUF6152)